MPDITPEELVDTAARLSTAMIQTSVLLRQREARIAELERDINSLNDMLRRTGYWQGQIDAYAAICEDNEACGMRIAELEQQVAALKETCAFHEKRV